MHLGLTRESRRARQQVGEGTRYKPVQEDF